MSPLELPCRWQARLTHELFLTKQEQKNSLEQEICSICLETCPNHNAYSQPISAKAKSKRLQNTWRTIMKASFLRRLILQKPMPRTPSLKQALTMMKT